MKRIIVLLAEGYRIVKEGFGMTWEAEADLQSDPPAAKVASGPSAIFFTRVNERQLLHEK
jgi:hypothetical protein